jgi:adenylyltransferase/sulfurtransferase
MVPSCAEGGVLGVLPGVIGCLQSTEIIKLALDAGEKMVGRLMTYNALDMKFRELKLRRDPNCPICGDHPTITELIDYDQFCGIPDAPEDPGVNPDEVTVQDMKKALDDPSLNIKVIDVRELDEFQIAKVRDVPLVPLSTLHEKFTELDPNQSYYIHCKAGVRSMKALYFLREQGFKHLKSVRGGISAWSQEIDPSVPGY